MIIITNIMWSYSMSCGLFFSVIITTIDTVVVAINIINVLKKLLWH